MPFLPTAVELDGVALGLERLDAAAGFLDQVRVEGAREPAVGGEQDDRGAGGAALPRRGRPPEQRKPLGQLGGHQVGEHLAQRLGVGPGRDHPVLRALQLGGGDQLHRPGDLPGVLDGADPPLELPALGHQSALKSGLNAAIAALSRLVMSSSRAFLVLMSFSTWACEASRYSRKSRSHWRISGHLHVVEVAVGHRVDDRHLLLDRHRLVLRLLQHLDQPGAAGELPLGGGVEVGAELGEGLQLAVLRQREPERAGHLLHRLDLGVAARPGSR